MEQTLPIDFRTSPPLRALILDKRAVMGTELCRSLVHRGYKVDILAESGSPAFYSRCCGRGLRLPSCSGERILQVLREALGNRYNAVFVCNEEILEAIMALGPCEIWPGLVLSRRSALEVALSKFTMVRIAAEAGVSIPRSFLPSNEEELPQCAAELGFPLIVKGDRGEAGNHVRMVVRPADLAGAYHEISALEVANGHHPMVQEFVIGTGYSVGGLFYDGRPLRLCAHRKVVGVPPLGGLTVSGVTENDPVLLTEACKIFQALKYTGLGHVEFIKDEQKRYRFIEINPRVWGTIAVAEYAGVDLFTPYQQLADGRIPEPRLYFRDGVRFHRIVREGRMIAARPSRVFGFLRDCLDTRVHSDFLWSDPLPHLASFVRQRPRHEMLSAAPIAPPPGERHRIAERSSPSGPNRK